MCIRRGKCGFRAFGVRVRYVSDVLGEGHLHHQRNIPSDVFPKEHLTRIFNLPARMLANATAEDGKERRWGMWEVTPVFHSPNAQALASLPGASADNTKNL